MGRTAEDRLKMRLPSSFAQLRDWTSRRAALLGSAALAGAAACLAAVHLLPLWGLTLWSIQFPKGLRMIVYPGSIRGNISDINVLNHYIGMAQISDDFFPELKVLPAVFAAAAVLCLVAALVRRWWVSIGPLLLLAGTAIYGFWSMKRRLFQFGNDLDPEAPITMDPFTPPMFGEFRIAQFATYSYFGLGTTLCFIAGVLVTLALYLHVTRVRWIPPGRPAPAMLVLALSFLFGSTADAEQVVAEPFVSLRHALAVARSGDTVRVPAGVHKGPFVIEHSITLIGDAGAVLDGRGAGTVVTVLADSVTISSLRIVGSGMSLDRDEAALRLQGCAGCTVERLVLDRSLHGIYLADASGVRIVGNIITGDTALAEGQRGNGIHLYNSGANHIANNIIRGTRDGIYFSFASGNSVDSNTVTEVRYGLHYMYSNDNAFSGNTFRRNAAGGAIMFSDRIALEGNDFSDHTGTRAYGLLLQTTSEVVATGNRFSGNLIGLFIDNSTRTMLRDNAVVGNGIGVDLLPSSRDNTLVGNWFLGNRIPVRIARGSGRSIWAEGGRGNYWGSNAVFDLDGDGVGDRPYRVGDAFATLAQARPALELFAGTPAARALSWADEALPAFTILRVVDPSPLITPVSGVATGGSVPRLTPMVTGVALVSLMAIALIGNSRRRSERLRGAGGSVQ
jgi:nitrous oxidase accessory protein